MTVAEPRVKAFKSPDYNFIFDMKDGFFARWGKTEQNYV